LGRLKPQSFLVIKRRLEAAGFISGDWEWLGWTLARVSVRGSRLSQLVVLRAAVEARQQRPCGGNGADATPKWTALTGHMCV
jgi:hypothetical protein